MICSCSGTMRVQNTAADPKGGRQLRYYVCAKCGRWDVGVDRLAGDGLRSRAKRLLGRFRSRTRNMLRKRHNILRQG